jgi:hypothetical protein
MKLTNEQKEKVIGDLSQLFGRATLRCDGYEVTLQVERFKGFKYRVMTYVNGTFSGKWILPSDAAPESKFLRKMTKPNVSPVKRLKLEKECGKRFIAKDPFFSGSYTCYLPDWSTGKAAVNHLCKVCESVELIDPATGPYRHHEGRSDPATAPAKAEEAA